MDQSKASIPDATCPDGTACPSNPDFWERGLCERCISSHAATPASCPPAAETRRGWEELFAIDIEPHRPPPLGIEHSLIPVILAQVRRYGIPERFAEVDAWAVPIHKVMNLRGRFRSSDLRDYLGLPPDRKLILSSVAPDPYMEVLWDRRHELDFPALGIDYWFPAHFSIYDADGRAYQLFNARRQQVYAIETRSQFAWFRIGESVPLSFLDPIRDASSILISCQQMHAARNIHILHREIEIADSWFPPSAEFFFISRPRGGLPAVSRRTYHLDFRWLMLGVNGRNMRNEPTPEVSIEERLVLNLREAAERVA